jgi:hypothetical protein
MRTPPTETEQRIADELGVNLCDFCGLPRLIHTGFDHRQARCLIDTTGVFAIQMYGRLSAEEKTESLSRIREWDRRVLEAEELAGFIGSGI